ncbi:unnamed protein product [Caenorhabditis sp. 36 PRJEB53466]|nr:unnamed protein product [Caenorhabditis sp. 36 PRJEB53466]
MVTAFEASILDVDRDESIGYQTHSKLLNGVEFSFSSCLRHCTSYFCGDNVSRPVRAVSQDEAFETSMREMQVIARIATAIYVQRGLIEGTIPADELISDLLRMGTVIPNHIIGMDKKNLTDALQALQDLPTKLKDTARMDGVLKLLDSLRKDVEGSGDVGNWDSSVFKSDVEAMARNGLNLTFVAKLDQYISEFRSIQGFLMNDAFSKSNAENYFLKIKKAVDELISMAGTIMSESSKVLKLARSENATSAMGPIMKAVAGYEKFQKIETETIHTSKDTADLQSISDNFDLLFNTTRQMKEVQPLLDFVKKLIDAQSVAGETQSPKHTAGWTEGAGDINQLFTDVDSPWIGQVVKENRLSKSFNPLKNLGAPFDSIHRQLELGLSSQIAQLIVHSNELIPETSKELSSAANGLHTCRTAFAPQSVQVADISSLRATVESLDATMTTLRTAVRNVTDQLTSGLQMFKDISAMCKEAKEKPEELESVVEKFKNYKDLDNMKKLVADVDLLLAPLNAENSKGDIKTAAQKIVGNFTVVETTKNSLKGYGNFFTCLQNVRLSDSVVKSLEKTRNLRTSQASSPANQGQQIAKKVVSTADQLAAVKEILEKMKEFRSAEADALTLFEDSHTHSAVIGASTRAAKMTLDRKPFTKEDENTLKSIASIKPLFAGLFTELSKWKISIKTSGSTALKKRANLFPSTTSISVQTDLKALIASVTKLERNVTDPDVKTKLKEIITALVTLDDIGLNFSDAQPSFDKVNASLAALDDFFAKYSRKLAPSQSQQSMSALQNNTLRVIAVAASTAAPSFFEENQTYVIIAIVVVVIFLAAGVSGIIAYLKHKKKEEENERERIEAEKERRKPDSSTSTPECAENEAVHAAPVVPVAPVAAPAPPTVDKKAELSLQKTQKIIVPKMKTSAMNKHITDMYSYYKNAYQRMDVRKCLAGATFNSGFIEFYCQMFESVETYTRICPDLEALISEETRATIFLMPTSRVFAKGWPEWNSHRGSEYMHANRLTCPNQLQFIMMQGPLAEDIESRKRSTIEKAWWMMKEERTEFIVMLCKTVETVERDGQTVQLEKCAQYFPEEQGQILQFDRLKVTCAEKTTPNREVIVRKLSAEFEGLSAFTVTHFQHIEWPDHSVPREYDGNIFILKQIRKSLEAIVVHCSAGVGRTGTFVYAEVAYQTLANNGCMDPAAVLRQVRDSRAMAIEKEIQLAYGNMLVYHYADVGMLTVENARHFESMKNGMIKFREVEHILNARNKEKDESREYLKREGMARKKNMKKNVKKNEKKNEKKHKKKSKDATVDATQDDASELRTAGGSEDESEMEFDPEFVEENKHLPDSWPWQKHDDVPKKVKKRSCCVIM